MDDPRNSTLARFATWRLSRGGLRPRVAASVIAVLWLISIVVFGIAEHLVDGDTFDNVWLGMWWATQTVTTVGYGDVVPDPGAGKVIAAGLMIGGLSFFAVITGVITSGFVARAQAEGRAEADAATAGSLAALTAELGEVRAALRRIESGNGGDEPPAQL
jgi:voltage-gated potassium channel